MKKNHFKFVQPNNYNNKTEIILGNLFIFCKLELIFLLQLMNR